MSPGRPVPPGVNRVQLNPNMTFTARVGGVDCSCLLDTGSSISVMNQTVFDALPSHPKLAKTATIAKTASQDSLPLLGRAIVSLKLGAELVTLPIYVSDRIDVPCLLGLDFLKACPLCHRLIHPEFGVDLFRHCAFSVR